MTVPLSPSPSAYKKAIQLLQNGQAVVLPTETVYGIAALANDPNAIANIYTLKSRPQNQPLSICIFTPEQAHDICHISPLAQSLINRFWPGPLTLVLPKKQGASIAANANASLSANREYLGLRCPDIAWRKAFLQHGFNAPLVLSSANTSGKPSPTTAKQARSGLGAKIPLIIDDGPCKSGMDSTIIAIKGNKTMLLRAGAIPAEDFAPFAIDWAVDWKGI